MKRRSILKTAIGAALAAFVPWHKSHASSTVIQDMIQERAKTLKLREAEPFSTICRLGRRQLGHARAVGLKPALVRLGKRERQVMQEGSYAASRILGRDCADCADPVTFAGVPIQWTDNECEMTVVTEKQ